MSWQGTKPGNGRGIAFLRDHIAFDGDECLIWPFSRNEDGYGQFGLNGKVLKAHRWMCEAINGPAPSDEHYAAHQCGNGHLGCIHPRHLAWKTHAENTDDAVRHGRLKGTKPKLLTDAQVLILRQPPPDKTIRQLSQEFGITFRHAKKVRQGISR